MWSFFIDVMLIEWELEADHREEYFQETPAKKNNMKGILTRATKQDWR